MSSAFAVAVGGAFQSSLSVILTVSYGVMAARLDMINPTTIKDVSTLCANVFLPALLFASIGHNISIDKLPLYIPVFIWSLVCILFSIGVGKLAARCWKLPSWTVAAATFNNTTSLPVLLTKSFASTGILASIAGSDINAAVERATSYYLVSSLVAKIATFTLGPYLFDKESIEAPPPPPSTFPDSPLMPVETTTLLPKYQHSNSPPRMRYTFLSLSPVTWSAILALVIGLTPPLHQLFFSLPQEGGYMSTWLSGSLMNIGELFAVLQIFIVGAKLLRSFQQTDSLEEGSKNPPARVLLTIFIIRFVMWSFLSVSVIYWVVIHTNLLPQDPILWWCMILMPIGPPAMTLSTLVDVINVGQAGKNMLAKTLAFMYAVTPVMSFSVVVALKVCEIAMEKRGAGEGALKSF